MVTAIYEAALQKNTYPINADNWNVMSERDTGVTHSCFGQGCGFTAYTFLPSKNITTLMTAWTWGWRFLKPSNSVFFYNHGRKYPLILLGSD